MLTAARSSGLSLELVREQFGRLGNTAYSFGLGNVGWRLRGVPFVQASVLNQMRREAVEILAASQTAQRPHTGADPSVAALTLLYACGTLAG